MDVNRSTYRPADEEHGDGTDYGHVANQGLQNHPHHPVQLKMERPRR